MISFEMTSHGRVIKVQDNRYDTDDLTWIEVLDQVVWPAFRAGEYYIDMDFTEQMEELHREYLENKMKERRSY